MADDRLDNRTPAQLARCSLSPAGALLRDEQPEFMVFQGTVAAIAAAGDDVSEFAPSCFSISGITYASVWPS